jgi:hypothetical protein
VVDFSVGQKVRAKRSIYAPADDYAPAGYLCSEGDTLIVRRLSTWAIDPYPVKVSHESETQRSFGVKPDEIEAAAGVVVTPHQPFPPQGTADPIKEGPESARMTEDEIHARDWWCPHCRKDVPPEMVTKDGEHYLEAGGCGRPVRGELKEGVGLDGVEPFTCWGLSSFCAETGHKCRAAGKCVFTPPADLPKEG